MDKTIFVKTDAYFRNRNYSTTTTHSTASSTSDFLNDDDETSFNKIDFEMGGFMLKRLPVRDGEHGYYRQVVFVSMTDMRTVPLTMGRFEVSKVTQGTKKKKSEKFKQQNSKTSNLLGD